MLLLRKATGLERIMFKEIDDENHTNYAGLFLYSFVVINFQRNGISSISIPYLNNFSVALLTLEDYLIEAPKYDLISRIECTEKLIQSKSECEIESFIRYLDNKGSTSKNWYQIFYCLEKKFYLKQFKDLPFQLDFVANTPVDNYSHAYLSGTELYVIRCDECRDLLPKCLRLDLNWLV